MPGSDSGGWPAKDGEEIVEPERHHRVAGKRFVELLVHGEVVYARGHREEIADRDAVAVRNAGDVGRECVVEVELPLVDEAEHGGGGTSW